MFLQKLLLVIVELSSIALTEQTKQVEFFVDDAPNKE